MSEYIPFLHDDYYHEIVSQYKSDAEKVTKHLELIVLMNNLFYLYGVDDDYKDYSWKTSDLESLP